MDYGQPWAHLFSVSKPEIQPSAPLQLRVSDVVLPFILSHSVPDTFLLLIPEDVVHLCRQEQCNDHNVDDEESLVPAVIQRRVVLPVYVAAGDVACLDTHLYATLEIGRDTVSSSGVSNRHRVRVITCTYIVEGRRDASRTHVVGILRCPCYQDRV